MTVRSRAINFSHVLFDFLSLGNALGALVYELGLV